MGIKRRHWASAAAPLALALLAVTGCESTQGAGTEPKAAPSTSAARSVARVCAEPAAGPAKAPAGAVTVDPKVVGDLAAKTKSSPPNTTFWLRPGKHRLEPDRYAQVIPKEETATSVRRARCSTAGRRTSTRSAAAPATSPSAT